MSKILNLKWSLGIAMGEFASTIAITFFIMGLIAISKNFKINSKMIHSFIMAICFSIVGVISMVFGMAIGNALSAKTILSGGDKGIALMLPSFAILQSFHYNAFNALPMIIGFQILGTIIGSILYIFFIKIFKLNNQSTSISYADGLLLNKSSYKENTFKEIIAQFLFITIAFFIFGINPLVIEDAEILMKGIYLSMLLFILFFMFSQLNYFMFSPFMFMASLAIYCLMNKKIKTSKVDLINLTISITIQMSFVALISSIDYSVRYL